MQYFTRFPQISYALTEVEQNTLRVVSRTVPNMTVRTKVNTLTEEIQTQPFETYWIRDEDRPDTLAAKYYGRSEYAWIILLANNLRDWYSWPLTDVEFYHYMNKKYESTPGALDGVARSKNEQTLMDGTQYYQTIDGVRYFVNKDRYTELSPTQRGFITVYEQERIENDERRTIRLPRREMVTSLIDQFNRLMTT